MKKEQHGRLSILLFALVLSVAVGCGEKEAPVKKAVVRPAKVYTVGTDDTVALRQYPGKVRAAQKVDLAFNIPGTLVKLPVKEGQDVKQGDLLARIDARDIRNALAAERAKLKDAKASYERHKKLLVAQVTTQAEYEKRERLYEVQKAAVRTAEKAAGDTELKAPYSGRIAKRYVDNFKEVQAKEPIVSLQDITAVEVMVDVSERVVAPIRERGSLRAVAEFPVSPGKQYPVTLKEFASEADPQTQTYRIVLTMPAPTDVNILPGMTATVTATPEKAGLKIDGSQIRTFLVPVAAVFADEAGKRFVWKLDDGMRVAQTEVQVGNVTGESIEVTQGLVAGERIVTAGVHSLEPGQQVRELKAK